VPDVGITTAIYRKLKL